MALAISLTVSGLPYEMRDLQVVTAKGLSALAAPKAQPWMWKDCLSCRWSPSLLGAGPRPLSLRKHDAGLFGAAELWFSVCSSSSSKAGAAAERAQQRRSGWWRARKRGFSVLPPLLGLESLQKGKTCLRVSPFLHLPHQPRRKRAPSVTEDTPGCLPLLWSRHLRAAQPS